MVEWGGAKRPWYGTWNMACTNLWLVQIAPWPSETAEPHTKPRRTMHFLGSAAMPHLARRISALHNTVSQIRQEFPL